MYMIIHVAALAYPYFIFNRWGALQKPDSTVMARFMYVEGWETFSLEGYI